MQPTAEITLNRTAGLYPPAAYDDLVKVWQKQPYEPVPVDYKQMFQDNAALSALLNNSPCVTKIIDLRTQQFDFISSNVEEVLGYNKNHFLEKGLSFYNTILHPDDLQDTWKLIKNIWNFILAVPIAEQAQYKFNYDYRVLKPNGKEARILVQHSVLQTDGKGTITHVLGVYSDISNWKKSEQQVASVVSTVNNTCFFITPDDTHPGKQKATLSKRELEVVKLMSEGFSSKIIADKLCISFHTVNTHRQKIMEKTNMRNTGGLVQFAVSNGLI